MCTIALPTIKEELGFDGGSLQWVMTAYALTVSLRNTSMAKRVADTNINKYGGFLMVGGRFGDIFGQEIILKVSMVAFSIFTLICGLVKDKVGFLIARALQGPSLLPFHVLMLRLIPTK